jgi:hypothetical protein
MDLCGAFSGGPVGFSSLGPTHPEAPYDHFCFWVRLPGITHEQALENMRLFASEVAPRVRDAVKARSPLLKYGQQKPDITGPHL